MPSSSQLDQLRQQPLLDAFIVGAGINGAITALALSRSGYRTAVVDKGDFASFTSQHSSNLIWGGIKYLENSELFLVRQLCKARNLLFKTYPYRVKEVRFTTLIDDDDKFDPWQIYAGTWLYWLLGSEATERPRRFLPDEVKTHFPELDSARVKEVIEYSDGHLPHNDARFVYRFIHDAHEAGALCCNYMEMMAATFNPHRKLWQITVKDHRTGHKAVVASRTLINCAGPFAEKVCELVGGKTHHKHLFSKGVHLIVRRQLLAGKVVTFFAEDGRPFFVIPMGPYSCVGTTDTPVSTPQSEVSPEDTAFILNNINDRLYPDNPIRTDEIITTRCGVRPLAVELGQVHDGKEDWTQLSRKHIHATYESQRFIAIYGGKLTDCLNVGDEMIDTLGEWLERRPNSSWIIGDDLSVRDVLRAKGGDLPVDADEIFARYGGASLKVLAYCRDTPSGEELIAPDLPYMWGEMAYLVSHEHVNCVEDVLRRRTLISHLVSGDVIRSSGWFQRLTELMRPKGGSPP